MTQMMICGKRDCKKNCDFKKPHRKTSGCDLPVHCAGFQPCIPCVRELQVGDRVRVTDKYDNSYMVSRMKEFLGKSFTIKSLRGKYVELEGAKGNGGVCWSWKPKDLKLITEDAMDKPKYKIKTGSRQATVWNLYKDGDGNCVEFQKHLANLMVVVGGNPTLSEKIDADILIQWAEQNPKRIKWLVENGYIELVESAYALWEKEAEIGGKTPSQTIEWARRMPRD